MKVTKTKSEAPTLASEELCKGEVYLLAGASGSYYLSIGYFGNAPRVVRLPSGDLVLALPHSRWIHVPDAELHV